MAADPKKLSQFWQELKKRKVVHVITVYLGAAFVIIQLISDITEPLSLPQWTPTLVIVLLIVGLPVAAIFSWIFDVRPEEGVAKSAAKQPINKKNLQKASSIWRIASYISFVVILGLIVLNVLSRTAKQKTFEELRSEGKLTLVVLPFQNLTNESNWNVWQSGIQNILITHLSNFSDALTVRQIESVDYLTASEEMNTNTSITSAMGSTISRKLGAEVFIRGSVSSDPGKIRINAQLIQAQSGEVIKSFQIEVDRRQELSFEIIDELTIQVKDYLLLSKKQQEATDRQLSLITTRNPEAFAYFVKGKKSFGDLDYEPAVQFLSQALELDSNFVFAAILLSWVYSNSVEFEKALEAHQIAYSKRDLLPPKLWLKTMDQHASFYKGNEARIKYLVQLPEYDDQDPHSYYDLGHVYMSMKEYQNAIEQYEISLNIYANWDIRPFWIYNYLNLGYAYHKTGQYGKEKRIYRKSAKDFPDHPALFESKAIFYLSKGKNKKASKSLEVYKNTMRTKDYSEEEIQKGIAYIYKEAGLLDLSEKAFRKVLEVHGETPSSMNDLASFLIETERGPEEGLKLIDQVLNNTLDKYEYRYLHTKGRALFMLGRYEEAIQNLNKAAKLYPLHYDLYQEHIMEAELAMGK